MVLVMLDCYIQILHIFLRPKVEDLTNETEV